MRVIRAADLFCGAGGTSTGLIEACGELGYEVELTAVNHWDVAVATHQANHPKARHLCASLDSINPRDLYRDGELDVLWGSPECTHHSIARGGKPINDQSRATAWCIVRWAEALRPPIILVENVKEFLGWGPIGSNGRPLAKRKGEVFHAWRQCLESLGYRVEWRLLCAADYGDPTTRERLFIYAVRGRRKIVWPEPTHSPQESVDLFGTRAKWVPAREIIDWGIEGKSIFGRKRPLAEKTLNRIWIGLQKFGLKPFTFSAGGPERGARSADQPLQTVMCRDSLAMAHPFLVHMRGNCDAKSLDKPAPALTAGGGHLGLAEPFLVQVNHGNGTDRNGDSRRVRTTDSPLPTVAGNRGEWAVIEPMLIGQQSGAAARPVDQPAPTVATSGAIALIEPYLISIDHQAGQSRSIRDPLSTISTKARHAVCEPYLVKFYSTGTAASIDSPLDTVTTNDRFGLAMPVIEIHGERYLLDIRFRMLKPHELAAAQGFPKDYKFTGNTTQVVRQIGNAVPRNLARSIVRAALSQSSQ